MKTAATSDYDETFDPPRLFVPVDRKALDGRRQLVRRDADYAAAQWTGDFWSHPYGPEDTCQDEPENIGFLPTHYAPRTEAEVRESDRIAARRAERGADLSADAPPSVRRTI